MGFLPLRLQTLPPNYLPNSLYVPFEWSKPDREWLPFCYHFYHLHWLSHHYIINIMEEGGCCLGNQEGYTSAWFLLSATWTDTDHIFVSALAGDGKKANTRKFSFLFLLFSSPTPPPCPLPNSFCCYYFPSFLWTLNLVIPFMASQH